VQQYSKEVYLRTAEASQCRVHSVLVLPLFADARRRGALGVLELVTTTDDLPTDSIVATLDAILQVCVRGSLAPHPQPCPACLPISAQTVGEATTQLFAGCCPAQTYVTVFFKCNSALATHPVAYPDCHLHQMMQSCESDFC